MSADTTNPSKGKMDCARVAREEILESYLAGRLADEDRNAFEEHYFECTRCFDDLWSLRAIEEELRAEGAEVRAPQRRPSFRWAWAAGLAAAGVLAALALWMRPTLSSGSREVTTAPLPSQVQAPERPSPRQQPLTGASEASLEQLARVEPPRYEPPRLRDTPDEATSHFQRGMEHYRKADYMGAIEDLRNAASQDPDAPHIQFFLGISHLMLGHDDDAIDWLRAAIALGDSPYLEEAHYYLAKAFLRRKDLGAAEIQLKRVRDLRGPLSQEATRLVSQVERLKDRSP